MSDYLVVALGDRYCMVTVEVSWDMKLFQVNSYIWKIALKCHITQWQNKRLERLPTVTAEVPWDTKLFKVVK